MVLDGEIQVSNRFSLLSETNMADSVSRADEQVSTINRQEFSRSSIDDKFLALFDELKFIRTELVGCSRNMSKVESSVNKVSEKLGQVVDVTNQQSDFLKVMAYKSIDLEARSRRNNLIFRGFPEYNGENCAEVIRDFLGSSLGLDSENVYIARAHRLGIRRFGGSGATWIGRNINKRPIIVNFRDYGVVETIMSRVSRLRGTHYSVDYDFPKEINDARKRLWPKLKEIRSQHPLSKPKIVYPAKLIANGRVLHDEFPDWNKVMSMSRVQPMNYISHRPVSLNSSTTMECDQVHSLNAGALSAASSVTTLDPDDTTDQATASSQSILSTNVQDVLTVPDIANPSVPSVSRQEQASIIQQNQSLATQTQTHVDPDQQTQAPASHSQTQHVYTEPSTTCSQQSIFRSNAPVNIPVSRHNTSTQAEDPDDRRPGVAHVSRAANRSHRRSESCLPYRRQSDSRSRASKNRTPNSQNSKNTCPTDESK